MGAHGPLNWGTETEKSSLWIVFISIIAVLTVLALLFHDKFTALIEYYLTVNGYR